MKNDENKLLEKLQLNLIRTLDRFISIEELDYIFKDKNEEIYRSGMFCKNFNITPYIKKIKTYIKNNKIFWNYE